MAPSVQEMGETFSSKKLNVHLWHAGLAAGYLHAAWKTHQPETVFAPRWGGRCDKQHVCSRVGSSSRSSAVILGLVDSSGNCLRSIIVLYVHVQGKGVI